MSNSVIKRELTALLQDKEYFDFLRHQRILVTGATGLIGSMFIKLLILANEAYGLDIQVIGHVRSHDKAQAILGNYLDNDSITLIDGALESIDVPCDYILHGAAPTQSKFFMEHPVETIRTSIHGTEAMLELGRHKTVKKLVYLSSMEQYGVPYESGQVMTEERLG